MKTEIIDYIRHCNDNKTQVDVDMILKIEKFLSEDKKLLIKELERVTTEAEAIKEKIAEYECPHPIKYYKPSGKNSCHFCHMCGEEV